MLYDMLRRVLGAIAVLVSHFLLSSIMIGWIYLMQRLLQVTGTQNIELFGIVRISWVLSVMDYTIVVVFILMGTIGAIRILTVDDREDTEKSLSTAGSGAAPSDAPVQKS